MHARVALIGLLPTAQSTDLSGAKPIAGNVHVSVGLTPLRFTNVAPVVTIRFPRLLDSALDVYPALAFLAPHTQKWPYSRNLETARACTAA